jgi:chromosome transmission fidelity protein 18
VAQPSHHYFADRAVAEQAGTRDLDALGDFETLSRKNLLAGAPTRYAVRQVLDQELQKAIAAREEAARQARFQGGANGDGTRAVPNAAQAPPSKQPRAVAKRDDDKENVNPDGGCGGEKPKVVRRDFFGRVITEDMPGALRRKDGNQRGGAGETYRVKVWVKYNEGLNNAVSRPITLKDFLKIF